MGLPSGLLWSPVDLDYTLPGNIAETPFTYMKSFFSWGNVLGHNPFPDRDRFAYDWGEINDQAPWYDNQVYGSTPGASLEGDIPLSMDAAHALLGAPWRIPTSADYDELLANIRYIDAYGNEVDTTKADKRVTVNGILGIFLESKINGARLFFSCSGDGSGRSWYSRGSGGHYFSSTWSSARFARFLYFYSGGVDPQYDGSRYAGRALRPVYDPSLL